MKDKGDRTRARARRWRPLFLAELAKVPCVLHACRIAGVSRAVVYRLRDSDEDFRADWAAALEQSIDDLEAEAFRRALRSSDSLTMFLLKAHKAEVYDRELTVAVKEQAPPPVGVVPVKTETEWFHEIPFSRSQLEWLAAIQAGAQRGAPSTDN